MSIALSENRISFDKSFWKDLKNIDPKNRRYILKKLEVIIKNIAPANIKKLRNYPKADYRVRIGDFRLLFAYNKEKGHVVFVHCYNRKDLY